MPTSILVERPAMEEQKHDAKKLGDPLVSEQATRPASDQANRGVADQAARLTKATGDEYAKALSSMISDAEAKAAAKQRRKSLRQSRSLLWFVTFALFAGVTWNVYMFMRPVPPPPPETQLRAGRITLFNTVKAIEAHRATRGALPTDLSVLTIPRGNYEYARADTGYTIELAMPDVVVTYRSGEDVDQLLVQAAVR